MKSSFKFLSGIMVLSLGFVLTGCAEVEEKKETAHNSVSTEEKHVEKEVKLNPAFTGGEDLIELPDGQYLEPYKLVDGVKEFNLVATPVEWETKEGIKKEAWTYNGVMPGPQLRVTEGDKVRIIIENKLPEETTIHWHGLHVPNNMDGVPGVTQDPIKVGDKFVYEFTAKNAGTHMYHSHANTVHQIDKGLFGTFIVDPKVETEKYDKEFSMMLSDGSMGYLINGKSFPNTKAWKVNKGDKVRVRVMNIGNQVHPMHIHGHEFTVISKDGGDIPKEVRATEHTLNLMSGNTYDVIFTATEGQWLFHCHVLPHAHEGHENSGMIQVIAVE